MSSSSSPFWRMQMPELLLVLCCAVDAADKALLTATFRTLERDLGASPSQLGVLVLCQTIACSIALPLWGAASAHFSSRDLLAAGCIMWGTATFLMACTLNFYTHCGLRFVNGFGLCCVMPVAQAMLCELVSEENRGAAFGRLQAASALAGMCAAWLALSHQGADFMLGGVVIRGWQWVYADVAVCSLCLAPLLKLYMPDGGGCSPFELTKTLSTANKIMQIPSFRLLVFQGVFGGVPWNAFGFIALYWHHCGYTDAQTAHLSIMQGFGGVVGALFGGYLGDVAARRLPNSGRILVALASVVLGMPLFMATLYVVPCDPAFFWMAGLSLFMFAATACWTPVAANRPICAELVSSSSERAQIVALWVTFESFVASICGAPLVGFLSERFGYKLRIDTAASTVTNIGDSSAAALAFALVGVSIVAWSVCALAWVAMLWTFPDDRSRARASQSLDERTSLAKTSKS